MGMRFAQNVLTVYSLQRLASSASLAEDGEVETRKPGCQCQRPLGTTPCCPQCRATVCATTVKWDFLHSIDVPHATTTGTTVPVQEDQETIRMDKPLQCFLRRTRLRR